MWHASIHDVPRHEVRRGEDSAHVPSKGEESVAVVLIVGQGDR